MNWNEVTIKKYNEIIQLDCDNDFETELRGIGILKDLSFEEVRNLPITKLKEFIEDVTKLETQDLPNKVVKKWKDYKIGVNINHMTAGQMFDYDTVRSQCEEDGLLDSKKVTANLHNIMAILTSPKDAKEFEDRATEIYNEMPIGVAHGCHVFFCKLYKAYEKHMLLYSKGEKKRIRLQNIGDGVPSSIY